MNGFVNQYVFNWARKLDGLGLSQICKKDIFHQTRPQHRKNPVEGPPVLFQLTMTAWSKNSEVPRLLETSPYLQNYGTI